MTLINANGTTAAPGYAVSFAANGRVTVEQEGVTATTPGPVTGDRLGHLLNGLSLLARNCHDAGVNVTTLLNVK